MSRRLIFFGFFILFNQVWSQSVTLSNSNLPIVIITTALDPTTGQNLPIVDEPKVIATMKIIYRPDGSRNYVSDFNNAEIGRAHV